MGISKRIRVVAFIERLATAPPAGSDADAIVLVAKTLNDVEDEMTSIPYNPGTWEFDGRMYPPQPDSARDAGYGLTRYRSKGHNTLIHSSGAIRLTTTGGICLLNKAAKNGYLIP
jgi:hypothetical protein